MTREEAKKILGENATEEQVTNLLNNYHVEESAKVKELEDEVNKLTAQNSKYSDYDSIKQKLDDINKANMTEQQKMEAAKEETKKNLLESRKIYNTAKAKEILSGLGLSDETISLVVSDDEAKTIANANKLKSEFDITKETVAKQTKESLMNTDLKPSISNVPQKEKDDGVMTFDKFENMSAEEQNEWLAKNPSGLENL